jgi:hypothetical protein
MRIGNSGKELIDEEIERLAKARSPADWSYDSTEARSTSDDSAGRCSGAQEDERGGTGKDCRCATEEMGDDKERVRRVQASRSPGSSSSYEPRWEDYARSFPAICTATTIPVAVKSAQQVRAVFLGALRKILDSPTSGTSRLHREPRTSKHLKCTARQLKLFHDKLRQS